MKITKILTVFLIIFGISLSQKEFLGKNKLLQQQQHINSNQENDEDHKCGHQYSKKLDLPESFVEQRKKNEQQQKRRALLTEDEAENIRITYNASKLDELDESTLRDRFISIVVIGIDFIEEELKILRLKNNNIYTSSFPDCDDQGSGFTVPQIDKDTGISESDLHIYINYVDNSKDGWAANSSICVIDQDTSRPTFGIITLNKTVMSEFNPDNIIKFQKGVKIVVHELIHILGFSSDSIQNWINPDTGNVYGSSLPIQAENVGGRDVNWLTTPNIKRVAADYYGCPAIKGMLLENSDAQPGDHWEKIAIFPEIMTGTQDDNSRFSVFTQALLKDTGYYIPKEAYLDKIYWGKGKGCDFLNTLCDNTNFEEFQPPLSDPSDVVPKCSPDRRAKVTVANEPFSDNTCYTATKLRESFPQGRCSENLQYDNITGEHFAQDSICFESTVKKQLFNGDDLRCLQIECVNDVLKLIIGGEKYQCTDGQTCQIDKVGQNQSFEGTVEFPANSAALCQQYKENVQCINFCSARGYCIGGKCVCQKGYSGTDCSKTCSLGQFTLMNDFGVGICSDCQQKCATCDNYVTCIACKTPKVRKTDGSCDCLDGYYSTGGTCEKCDYTCGTCENQNRCLTCANEIRLKELDCNCPSNYFRLIGDPDCFKCDYNCATCSKNTKTCLTCSHASRYKAPQCVCLPGYKEDPDNPEAAECVVDEDYVEEPENDDDDDKDIIEKEQEEEEKKNTEKTNSTAIIIITVVGTVVIIALGVGIFLKYKQRKAHEEREIAPQNENSVKVNHKRKQVGNLKQKINYTVNMGGPMRRAAPRKNKNGRGTKEKDKAKKEEQVINFDQQQDDATHNSQEQQSTLNLMN